MSKPDDIPQDIWDAAEAAFDLMLCNDIQASGTTEQFRTDSITPHARAILAERDAQRERDAKLADGVGNAYGDDETGWAECSEVIARTIRKGAA